MAMIKETAVLLLALAALSLALPVEKAKDSKIENEEESLKTEESAYPTWGGGWGGRGWGGGGWGGGGWGNGGWGGGGWGNGGWGGGGWGGGGWGDGGWGGGGWGGGWGWGK